MLKNLVLTALLLTSANAAFAVGIPAATSICNEPTVPAADKHMCLYKHGEAVKSAEKEQLLRKAKAWTPLVRTAYKDLLDAAWRYQAVFGASRRELKGPDNKPRTTTQGSQEAWNAVVTSLQTIEKTTSDSVAYPDLTAIKHVNARYRELLLVLEDSSLPDSEKVIRQTTLQEEQGAWLEYRNAWITFAALHKPAVSAAQWDNIISSERTDQLVEYQKQLPAS